MGTVNRGLLTGMLTGLLLCTQLIAANADDYVSVKELRTETAGGWHESYQTAHGQIRVALAINIPKGIEQMPLFSVKAGLAVADDKLLRYDQSFMGKQSENGGIIQLWGNFNAPAYGDFLYEIPMGATIPTMADYTGIPFSQACDIANEEIKHLFGNTIDDYFLDSVYIARWEKRETLRLVFSQKIGGFPVFNERFTLDVRDREYHSINASYCMESGVREADLPLIAFAAIKEKVETMIVTGEIDGVKTISLGYLNILNKEKPDSWLYPVWMLDCTCGTKYRNGIQTLIYMRLYFSAQSGEELVFGSEKGYVPPEIVIWDNVQ